MYRLSPSSRYTQYCPTQTLVCRPTFLSFLSNNQGTSSRHITFANLRKSLAFDSFNLQTLIVSLLLALSCLLSCLTYSPFSLIKRKKKINELPSLPPFGISKGKASLASQNKTSDQPGQDSALSDRLCDSNQSLHLTQTVHRHTRNKSENKVAGQFPVANFALTATNQQINQLATSSPGVNQVAIFLFIFFTRFFPSPSLPV